MNEQDASLDVTKDVPNIAVNTNPPSHHSDGTIVSPAAGDTSSVVTAKPAYFTEGEMLPWKGTWWRIRLREIDGEKLLTLVKVKPTSASEKQSKRAERWNEQHSRKSGVKRELKAMLRLIRGAGVSSGSQELQQEQA